MSTEPWEAGDIEVAHVNVVNEYVVYCVCGSGDTVVADGEDDNVDGDGRFIGDSCKDCGRRYRVIIQVREKP